MPLAFPSVGIQHINMRLRRTVAVSESPFTYSQQVYEHTFGHPLHTSTATTTTSGTTSTRAEELTTDSGSSAVTAGTYFQLGDYLYMATEDKASGAGTLKFQPPLRGDIASGTALDFTLPKSLWRMASNDIGWSTDTASIYGFTMACVEAI